MQIFVNRGIITVYFPNWELLCILNTFTFILLCLCITLAPRILVLLLSEAYHARLYTACIIMGTFSCYPTACMCVCTCTCRCGSGSMKCRWMGRREGPRWALVWVWPPGQSQSAGRTGGKGGGVDSHVPPGKALPPLMYRIHTVHIIPIILYTDLSYCTHNFNGASTGIDSFLPRWIHAIKYKFSAKLPSYYLSC